MIILVVGVPGVGKTTVINEAKKYLKKDIAIINIGDIMFELAKERFNINTRDEIRKKISFQDQVQLQIEAANRILEIGKNKDVIVDTHFVIESFEGYIPGLFKEFAEIIKPNAIAIIISDPDKIFLRRLKDSNIRARDIENLERIKIQQEMTIYYSLILMYEFKCKVEVIENEEGLIEESSKKLAEFINKNIQSL